MSGAGSLSRLRDGTQIGYHLTVLQPPRDATTLADRLNWLFTLTPNTSATVSRDISNGPNSDVTLSKSYLTALRSGRQANPTISVVSALVRYFNDLVDDLHIDTDWLIDGTSLQTRGAEDELRFIAARAGQLSPELREDLIERIRSYQSK